MLNVYGPDMIHVMLDVESSKTSEAIMRGNIPLLLLSTRETAGRNTDERLVVLVDTGRALEARNVDTGDRPPAGERADLLAELFHLRVPDLALLLDGRDAHEVLEELAAGLLLEHERDLNCAVQEVGDNLHVCLEHVARGQRGRAETDTAGHLRGRVTRYSVLCETVNIRLGQRAGAGRIRTVDGDADEVAQLLELGAGEAKGAQVPED